MIICIIGRRLDLQYKVSHIERGIHLVETDQGLILVQRSSGEKGRFIDILTAHNTLREVYVRGSQKVTSANLTVQQFSYATFSIASRKERYYLDSVQPIHIFYHLRDSLSRLSLASYFSELVRFSVQEFHVPKENCQVFRLMLNTLHYLEEGTRPKNLLKPIFELRLMTELGMMPDLLICRRCSTYLPESLYFSPRSGYFHCAACQAADPLPSPILLQRSGLQAMRHIVFADFHRLFSWNLGEKNLAAVGRCTEAFVRYHLDLQIPALDFYHQIAAERTAQEQRGEAQHESI